MNARNVVGVAIGVGVLIILVIGAVVAAGRDSNDYPDGSPEAAVQDYFQAIIDERPDEAGDLFTDELRERCDRNVGLRFESLRLSRVVLDEVVQTKSDDGSDRVRVRVRITETWGDGVFESGESTFTEVIALIMEDGVWRISSAPWPYFDCRPFPEVEE